MTRIDSMSRSVVFGQGKKTWAQKLNLKPQKKHTTNTPTQVQPPDQPTTQGKNKEGMQLETKRRIAAYGGILAVSAAILVPVLRAGNSQEAGIDAWSQFNTDPTQGKTFPSSGGGNASASNVQGPVLPPRESIIRWAQHAWEGKDFKSKDWNAVRVALEVSDDTRIMELEPYREQILQQGTSHADIPADVIQSAIYTAGILTSKTNDPKLKSALAGMVQPYFDSVLVERLQPDGTWSRQLITMSAEDSLKSYQTAYSRAYDLRPTARFALQKIASKESIAHFAEEFLEAESDSELASSHLEMLRYAPQSADLGAVEDRAKEIVDRTLDVAKGKVKGKDQVSSDEAELFAQAVRFLSERGDSQRGAIEEWYEHSDSIASFLPADCIILSTLAKEAQSGFFAFNSLKKAIATEPSVAGNVLFSTYDSLEVGPETEAREELTKALNAHRGDLDDLLVQMVEDRADTFGSQANSSQRYFALVAMGADRTGKHIQHLRDVAADPSDLLRSVAVAGLGQLRDKESLDLLMGIAANVQETDLSNLAMAAVLQIAGHPDLPPELARQANAQNPFSTDYTQHFIKADRAKGTVQFVKNVNPFTAAIAKRYKDWLEDETKLRRASGMPFTQIEDEEKLAKLQESYGFILGSGQSFLSQKGQDPVFQARYLAPMVSYLENAGKEMDLEATILMMAILGKTHYQPATPVLADMVKHPEQYGPDFISRYGLFGLYVQAYLPAFLKIEAVKALGGAVHPADEAADLPQQLLYDPYKEFQWAAYTGLQYMGDNLQEKLAQTKDPVELNKLKEAQKRHIQQLFETLDWVNKGYTKLTQQRRPQDYLQYKLALAIDGMGGTKQLLERAQKQWDNNNQQPTQEVRSIIHALLTNGHTRQTVADLGFDAKMVDFFTQKKFWFEGIHNLPAVKDVKGGEHAQLDVGYPLPLDTLKGKIAYPEWIDYNDVLGNWTEPHPTGTTESFRQMAKGVSKVHAVNVSETLPWDPAKPIMSQDGMIQGLENLIQKQIEGKTHITTSNSSIGFMNFINYSSEIRERMLDYIAAYYEAFGETGVTNVVSAGNSQAEDPMAQYDPVGTQNTLASRISKDGRVTQVDSTVVVAAADGLFKWLAEFSSMPNPLRLEDALDMYNAPGYQDMTMYRDHETNEWVRMPVDGTSFSAPNTAGLIHLMQAVRQNRGLAPWTPEQLKQALDFASAPLPGREEWESGRYIDTSELLKQALKPTPAKS